MGRGKRGSEGGAAGEAVVSFVGAGRLANFLAPALRAAGHRIDEIVVRVDGLSIKRARTLARRVGARAVSVDAARLGPGLIWFAVPDSEIRPAAELIARRLKPMPASSRPRFAFHSSGAAGSRELNAMRRLGIAVASVHPLMTFVAGVRPSLAGVPFAMEGDDAAVRSARAIVRGLGAVSFVLDGRRKPAYHAWATMTSPLLVAYLVAMQNAARVAGLRAAEARRMSLPIVQQTLENYGRMGPAVSFSGPFVRGDVETVAKHLALLKRDRKTRAVYLALARVALDGLPVKNRPKLLRLLKGDGRSSS